MVVDRFGVLVLVDRFGVLVLVVTLSSFSSFLPLIVLVPYHHYHYYYYHYYHHDDDSFDTRKSLLRLRAWQWPARPRALELGPAASADPDTSRSNADTESNTPRDDSIRRA